MANILFISSNYPPEKGAAAVIVSEHAKRLVKLSIAAKKSPKVPLQKSPGVGNFTLALLNASLKIPRTCVL